MSLSHAAAAHTYCAAITAHEGAGRWKDALRLLAAMQKRDLAIDEHCLNAALAVCAAAGEADVATRLLRRCPALGVKPTTHHYTTVLSSYARAGQSRWHQALSLLDEMSARGVQKDAAVYRALAQFESAELR